MKVKSVVDDFVDRTVTNLQLVCHLLESRPILVENLRADMFTTFSLRCGWAP